jgi:hypothetical protein
MKLTQANLPVFSLALMEGRLLLSGGGGGGILNRIAAFDGSPLKETSSHQTG